MRCLRKGVATDSLLGVCVVVHHGLHVHHHDHEEVTEGLEVILDVAQLCKVGRGGGCRPGLDRCPRFSLSFFSPLPQLRGPNAAW